jgi:hypothetical protein
MNSTTITAIINLVTALLPTLEAGAVTLYADVKQLLADANASGAATPDQVSQVQSLDAASDAALEKAHAAYAALGNN